MTIATVQESIERLTYIKEAIQEAIKEGSRLDMNDYASSNWNVDFEVDYQVNIKEANECGTVCCILGWAGTHPKLQELGLRLMVSPNWTIRLYYNDEYPSFGDSGKANNDVGPLFGITDQEADALFSDFQEDLIEDSKAIRRAATGGLEMSFERSIMVIDMLIQRRKDNPKAYSFDSLG